MRIVVVTGSYPPDVCGVGDYTSRLVTSLEQLGTDVQVLTGQRWSLFGVSAVLTMIASYRPEIVHLQYPTFGFGYHLGPQALAIMRPTVVTIHEATQAHILRRLSLYGFSVRTQRTVFTTEVERAYSTRWCPWIADRSVVIPIGSNVPVSVMQLSEKSDVVGYFGLIRPQKGLEEILKLGLLLRSSKSDLRIRIIGRTFTGLESYYSKLRHESGDLPIDWFIDADDTRVASLIGSCKFAYLPFPDGASERRSSLIAMMEAGSCIVTTHGEQTANFMESSMRFAKDPEEAFQIINGLRQDDESCRRLQEDAKQAAERFSWNHIAKAHIDLYREILNK
jgi:glycosyltransferase involved in cell wall biosynthesis